MEIKRLLDEEMPFVPVTHPKAVLDENGYDEYKRTELSIIKKAAELGLTDREDVVDIINNVTTDNNNKLVDTAQLLAAKLPNLLTGGEFDDRKLDNEGNPISGETYCAARKIAVNPNTCYYINRRVNTNPSANTESGVWLEDIDGNITPPLNSDGSERTHTYNVYQIYPGNGVIKTRSDSAYMHVALGYRRGTWNRDLLPEEYCLEYSHPILPAEYNNIIEVTNNLYLRKKKYKVLLIGSSYGVNTIGALAPLALDAGIDITVGNLFNGAITLANQLDKAINDTPWVGYHHYDKYAHLYYGETDGFTPRGIKPTLRNVLNDEDWDCVILMRSAEETQRGTWKETDSANLQALIDFVEENCPSHPKILWNSAFAYPLGAQYVGSREQQQAFTDNIIANCETIKATLWIDYIPIAKAIQLCRNDATINDDNLDLSDGSVHLNNGIGMYVTACCCFEYIFSKVFDMSVRTQTYIHTYADLGHLRGSNTSAHNNDPVLTGDNFKAPTLAQARLIRKYVQIACR